MHTLPEIPAAWRLIRSLGLITWDKLEGLTLAVSISWTASKLERCEDKRGGDSGTLGRVNGQEGGMLVDAANS